MLYTDCRAQISYYLLHICREQLLVLTQGVCISIIPSRWGYFLIDLHSRISSDKADPEESTILLKFQNVVDLSKYIIDTYDRLDSYVQYEIQQLFVEVMLYQKKKYVES